MNPASLKLYIFQQTHLLLFLSEALRADKKTVHTGRLKYTNFFFSEP